MLWTAPGVKLPSYRKNGFNPSLWRCGLPFVLDIYVANLFDGLFKKRVNICREIRRKFVETLSNLPYTRNFTLNLRKSQ